ncbi:MAG: chromosome segregation protein SMC [Sulfuricaulis sp.]|uniref:chromosome segregation protein SMC n=1 Tax=Sulfuricaulis sp. TaxID=2003553 RepID=UPI0034A29C11
MRLKIIKLSGFKSFVEPITIPITGDLIGVVGPNGCGKSNIIDAVRWVMGEMSAKTLRGDSMADVIFNGSNTRKPVAMASVELIFDNSDGSAGGQYASYAEISIRREAGRDGLSDYYLNKTKCRRKDIMDIFLGTGLGPRAYSIIEQGMVTRIVEAKPEELRGYIEEAAGISKYKERRRETENRIKHTRENLTRVEDICRELELQLSKLQRQSRAAARYKELKQEERLTRAQLFALRWQDLDARVGQHDAILAQQQTSLDAALSLQRASEAEIEKIRAHQSDALDLFNGVQAEFYSVGADVSRLEQAIQHARETRENQAREQEQINRTWSEADVHLQADVRQMEEIKRRLEALGPQLDNHRSTLEDLTEKLLLANRALQDWQQEWETFGEMAAEPSKIREVQTARIRQMEQHVSQLRQRQERLAQEAAGIIADLEKASATVLSEQVAELDDKCESLERSIGELDVRLREARDRRDELDDELAEVRGVKQNCEARLASLQELQAAARGESDAALKDWLRDQDLEKAPRLARLIEVEPGWEKAVERVLGINLAAVCVPRLDKIVSQTGKLTESQVSLIDLGMSPSARQTSGRDSLLDKIRCDIDLAPLLDGIYIADSLEQALAVRGGLTARESIVTRAGAWVGRNWLSHGHEKGARTGWLLREREIETLQSELTATQKKFANLEAQFSDIDTQQQVLEDEREDLNRDLSEDNRERSRLREQLGREQARKSQLESRRAQIDREQIEINEQLKRDLAELESAGNLLQQAEATGTEHEQRRAQLQQNRRGLEEAAEQARVQESAARDRLHRLEIERETLQTSLDATQTSYTRLEGQLRQLVARREQLALLLAVDQDPAQAFRQQLDQQLQKRLGVEDRLTVSRQAVSELENRLREQEQARTAAERQVGELREQHEGERVARQEIVVRRDTLADQLRETGFEIEPVRQELPAAATEQDWATKLEAITARIERLGPINLVAIEEFEEMSSRKNYLDKQFEDLSQALTTLEEAIRKIDRETRIRFKETFDRVNENFQAFFPQLFGGGSSHLEMTDNNLLETGVTVMARPPGKRNSTIHLLSGGEKALTAVAIVFAIFQLNPAPFCLLDEVDAPLDDANVIRYCETLKTLSQKTQLVYITHNKISMEMADVLIGVTMSEPGVSRLVAVDVEQAMEMVAQ